jgi:hypothetical protein
MALRQQLHPPAAADAARAAEPVAGVDVVAGVAEVARPINRHS